VNAEGFDLRKFFQNTVRFWWIFFICMLMGGLIGLGFTVSRKPLYEASATLLITVDRGRSIVIDDFTVVQATDRVRALILSDKTLKSALELLSASTSSMDGFDTIASFRSALRITQGPANFGLFVYADEPALAAEGANAWAKASLAALDEAYLHAIRAAEFQYELYEANCTLTLREDESQQQAVWLCTSRRGEVEENSLPEEILKEVKASRGILPIFSFALGQEAQSPQNPILWARSSLIISGLILGVFLGSLIMIIIDAKDRSQ
jgi:hypothetical protein